MIRRLRELLRMPLIRLLAINLAIGIAVALLMLGGLIALDAGGLRRLLLADRMPVAALALLGFGLMITFGSVAMGSAIMALGRNETPPRDPEASDSHDGDRAPAAVRVRALHPSP